MTLDGNHYGNNWGDLSELSYPWYAALGDQPAFDGVFGRFGYKLNVGSAGHTEEARGEIVTGSYFPVLGVTPALGRLLSPGRRPAAPRAPRGRPEPRLLDLALRRRSVRRQSIDPGQRPAQNSRP